MASNRSDPQSERLSFRLAIVGGGRTCRFFVELIKSESFPLLDIELAGVCDIDPQAEGLLMAQEMGIYTTDDFRDFFKIRNLDGIIELTNSREVLLELIKLRPKRLAVVEHNIGKLLRTLFTINQRLNEAEHQAILGKMSSDFLIQQSNAAIAVLNTDFTIAEANEAYLNMVNKTKEDVIGAYCYEAYYGLSAPCSVARPTLKCPMVETMKTGKSAHVIHESAGSRENATYGNIVTYPLKDQNGDILRIIEIWRDVTEEISDRWAARLKEIKADLHRMVQEDRMISLGKLVASCVHEINNPIQGLLTFSHLMQEMVGNDQIDSEGIAKFKEYLAIMSAELDRCGSIVSGLLSFSRETPLSFTDINMNDVITAVISLTRHKAELQNIHLSVNLSPEILLVRGETHGLQQCILNLVFNAIESMPQGGSLDVKSSLDVTHKHFQIEIHDTGCGISQENMEHIFDPFFTTKSEGKGTGLGLSIVYGIVKNHGGKVDVKSISGKGTSFILTFPAKQNKFK
jgi:signal transduction histidine kinase